MFRVNCCSEFEGKQTEQSKELESDKNEFFFMLLTEFHVYEAWIMRSYFIILCVL